MGVTAAVYSRKSKVSDKGESIQNQLEMCREYAVRQYGSCEFLLYEDEGYSGGSLERPAFHRMMQDAQAGRFQVLICYRLDRISRSVVDFSSTLESLSRMEIAFISITEHFDTSTPMGRAMMYIASVFAQLERETIAERIRDNMLKLARTGRWLGGPPPYGFRLETSRYTGENGAVKKYTGLKAVPEEKSVIQQVYQFFLEIQSVSGLVERLKAERIHTRKDGLFTHRTLTQMLRNPVYVQSGPDTYAYFQDMGVDIACGPEGFQGTGLILCNRHAGNSGHRWIRDPQEWILAPGSHPGVIAEKDWLQVQQQLSHRKMQYGRGRAGSSRTGLLGGLLVCCCGGKMRITYRSREKNMPARHYYYRCRRKNEHAEGCSAPNVNGRAADPAVLAALEMLAEEDPKPMIQRLKRYQKEILEESRESRERKLAGSMERLEQNIAQLTRQLARPEATEEVQRYLLVQIQEYDRELKMVSDELEHLRNNRKPAAAMEDLAAELFELVAGDFQYQKKRLQMLVSRVQWDGEGLEVFLSQ